MRKYTKHKIWRLRDLNDKYREVLFSKESLSFAAGSMVKLYNTDKPSCFIASGISYPWIRLIGNRDLFSDIRGDYIKLDINISNPVPSLMSAREPTFIVSSECCGAFFSYYSTYPQRYKICYLGGDEIQLDWIREHCDLIEDPKEAISNELYVMGRRDLFTDDIINISKESYLV